MKNYLLAVAFTALLAAVYSVQNAGYVTVRFLFWTRDVPQGIWEAAIFAAGCVVMWLLSLFGSMEMRDRCMEKVSDLEARIGKLEKNCSLQEESASCGKDSSSEGEQLLSSAIPRDEDVVERDKRDREEQQE